MVGLLKKKGYLVVLPVIHWSDRATIIPFMCLPPGGRGGEREGVGEERKGKGKIVRGKGIRKKEKGKRGRGRGRGEGEGEESKGKWNKGEGEGEERKGKGKETCWKYPPSSVYIAAAPCSSQLTS